MEIESIVDASTDAHVGTLIIPNVYYSKLKLQIGVGCMGGVWGAGHLPIASWTTWTSFHL